MHKKKYAVFTMDVEAFTDTDCLSDMSDEVNVDLLDGFEEYIKLLDKHGIKSTLFTVGNLIPRLTERLRPHLANGHRLALHNYDHIAPMKIRPEEFKSRLKKSKKQLQEELNTEVVGFRAPCFSLDKERLDILHELGFRYDSSHLGYLKANHTVELDLGDFEECRRGIFRRKGFYEFEISKQNFFGKPFPISGGGYVRLFHWDIIRTLIWQYIRRNDYYVFYLHPFEMTREKVPQLKNLGWADRYYLHHGIGSYRYKIEQIICMLKKCGYEFVTFEELVGILENAHKDKA